MDTLNKTVMQLLVQNARYSNQEIASMAGASIKDVEAVINTLIKDGVIRQFTTIMNTNSIEGVPLKHWLN